jgi:glucans biosynthesis protein C
MISPLAPAILAVPIGIAFSLEPTWVGWFGVRTPDESLLTSRQALIGFGTRFGFGWLLHRQIDLLRILEKRWLIHLAFAIGLIAMSFLVTLPPHLSDARSIPISIDTLRLAGAAFYALAIWTGVIPK